jgi:hypothetical protein
MPVRTSRPSRENHVATSESTGIDRLYKRYGARKISFWYKYPDGRSETLTAAPRGGRAEIAIAECSAERKVLDIQAGEVIAGSVADMIDRFKTDIAPTHFRDQSKDRPARKGGRAERRK